MQTRRSRLLRVEGQRCQVHHLRLLGPDLTATRKECPGKNQGLKKKGRTMFLARSWKWFPEVSWGDLRNISTQHMAQGLHKIWPKETGGENEAFNQIAWEIGAQLIFLTLRICWPVLQCCCSRQGKVYFSKEARFPMWGWFFWAAATTDGESSSAQSVPRSYLG